MTKSSLSFEFNMQRLKNNKKKQPLSILTPKKSRCHRFQANIFNKRKCQNCFRPLDSHTSTESDLHTSKPVKAGWLLLCPEGIDFLNPAHMNRKWQRRYFTLYENGLLRFALDEMPSTVAQGTVNMSQCSDILDASSHTSFSNSLRLCFSDRDYYIRTESSDITGWQENLLVHVTAAKASCKKRRREPSLLLHQVKKHIPPERNRESDTSCINGSGNTTKKRSPETKLGSHYRMRINDRVHHEDLNTRIGAEGFGVGPCNGKDSSGSVMERVAVAFTPSSFPGVLQEEPEEIVDQGGVHSSSSMSKVNSYSSSYLFSNLQLPSHFQANAPKSREGIESGYSSLEKTRSDAEDVQTGSDHEYSRSQAIGQFERENGMHISSGQTCSSSSVSTRAVAECNRANRSTTRAFACGYGAADDSASSCRRSKSLERNLAEQTPTPDLLNLKKGWMTKLGEDGKWRRHWVILTNQSLRFYKDSVADETAELDGEIDLSTCYDITDFPVQRNYGFQIHSKPEAMVATARKKPLPDETKDGVFALCAMTFGIRRNWIEALRKKVQMPLSPDVTCSVPQIALMKTVSACTSAFVSDPPCSDETRSRIAERRREGRYKTFDWAEFSHIKKKRDMLRRQSGVESEFVPEGSVPPAPAPSPEDVNSVTLSTHEIHNVQDPHVTKFADSSLSTRSGILTGKSADQKSAAADVEVFNDLPNTLMEKKKETHFYTLGSPGTFSSRSVQTEFQWDLELQTLHTELKAMCERIKLEAREYKLSEAHLQAELSDRLHHLRETESKLWKTEATVREQENAVEELQKCLEELSGRLKATDEALALKDVRLQRHLRLLQESQERERWSLSNSLEHAEKHGKELAEQLMQTEAMLQKMPTGNIMEQLSRKCQELQNQLNESDSELNRLQARLQNEETLYYDMEHNYEQVCEELEFVRGSFANCEKMCEEHFRIQLEQQQEKFHKKEQELERALLKMGCSAATLEMTGIFQPPEFNLILKESPVNGEKLGNFGISDLEKLKVAQGDDSEQVISVIQALESKLCDTEERLQEITVDTQQQQEQVVDEANTCKIDYHWSLQETNKSLGTGTRIEKHSGLILEKSATNSQVNSVTSKMLNFDIQEALQDKGTSPEKLLSQKMTNRILALEALVIQRMASVLEHPTKQLLDGLSELQSQTKAHGEACEKRHEGPVTRNYSYLFSYYQNLGEGGCSLNECEIYSMCMTAELAYLMYTNHLHDPEVAHGSQAFNVPFYPGSKVKPPDTTEGTSCKTSRRLSNVGLPELIPCNKLTPSETVGCCPGAIDKDNLVVELQAHALSLQTLSKQLYPLVENTLSISLSEFSPVVLRTVLFQAALAYVSCKLHVALQRRVQLLQDHRTQACRLDAMLQEQVARSEEKLREDRAVIEVAPLTGVSSETDAKIKVQELKQHEAAFKKMRPERQQIHEREMTCLHEYYTGNQSPTVTTSDSNNGDAELSVTAMKERIQELELHIGSLEEECLRGDINTLRQAYEQELEALKVTCELGFSSMEQSHQRVIEEMQRQHQIEVEQLLEERERVLQEETNATITAIEAMHKAHMEELEKTRNVPQHGASADVNKLRAQFKDELDSLHRELGVLSEQYSQKCLANANLIRTLEVERHALSSVERENQELHTRNHELNKRLVSELSLIQSFVHKEEEHTELSQSKDVIQLEVALRVKESELQCVKQEVSSLKEELQAANRHCKKLLNEVSVSGVRCPSLTSFIKRSGDACKHRSHSYDVIKSKSNPDFMKNHSKPHQPTRSKSLKEHVSVQDRMKLFDSAIK